MMLFLTQTSPVAARRTDVHRRPAWPEPPWQCSWLLSPSRRPFCRAGAISPQAWKRIADVPDDSVLFDGCVHGARSDSGQPSPSARDPQAPDAARHDQHPRRGHRPLADCDCANEPRRITDSQTCSSLRPSCMTWCRDRAHPSRTSGEVWMIVVSQYLRDVIGQTEAWHSFARSILS